MAENANENRMERVVSVGSAKDQCREAVLVQLIRAVNMELAAVAPTAVAA